MVRLMIGCVLLVSGIASRYDPEVMDAVARNRRMPPFEGAQIAVLDCSLVGKVVRFCYEDACHPARVTDCAGIADGGADWMIRNNIAAEFDYHTAVSLELVGKHVAIFLEVPKYQWR